MNNQDVHPVELFLAALIALFELICWTINELAGHHQATAAPAQATPAPSLQDLTALTVKQLQAITGVRTSRYRKSDLVQLAIQQAERGGLVHA